MNAQARPRPPPAPLADPTAGSALIVRREDLMEVQLTPRQAADLASLLAVVSAQERLGSGYRNEASYWADQVGWGLDAGDMQLVAWLLEDVAGSPLLPDPLQQWAGAWARSIRELTDDYEAY
jgi:hypothetical protein